MPEDYLKTAVSEIMVRKVVTVEMDDSLESMREIFHHVKFHHLLVVHDKKLVGVVSDRDLLKQISPFFGTFTEQQRDKQHLNKRVHQIMTRKLITVEKNATVAEAAQALVKNAVSCLPVINDHGGIEGIITWKDILCYLVQKGDFLENNSGKK
jgi:acetoin utilization protein AcuB